jgi:CRP-like cAMP-binding protein
MPSTMKLTDIELLKLFDSPGYADLARTFTERRWTKKTLICTPYDADDRIFLVKTGRLRVFLSCEEREFTLALLEPGDLFSTHTRAFVEALDDSTLLWSSTRSFQQQITTHPEITWVMVEVLGDLLKNSLSIIEGLVFKNARRRLLDFLLAAAMDKGRPQEGEIRVELGLNTEEIARLLGSTRQTVSTLLNDLVKANVVARPERGTLLIRDINRLKGWDDVS